MSNQRRIRSELRQGLHQFLMQIYESYAESATTEEAKKLVAASIEDQYELFTGESIAITKAKEALVEKAKVLTNQMEKLQDYDAQLYYAEKIDTLNAAIDALDFNNQGDE